MAAYAGANRDKWVSVFLLRLAENIQWPNQSEIKKYHIHVIDQSNVISNHLKHLANSTRLHGKPIEITHSSQVKLPQGVHLVYLAKKLRKQYSQLHLQLKGQATILISDSAKNQRLGMVNLKENKLQQLSFEINKANIINQRLGVHPDIVLLGGSEIDVAELYRDGQVSFQQQAQQLKTQHEKIEVIKTEKNILKKKLKKQQHRFEQQSAFLRKSQINMQYQKKQAIKYQKMAKQQFRETEDGIEWCAKLMRHIGEKKTF